MTKYTYLIEQIKEQTGKTVCECKIDSLMPKYELFNSFFKDEIVFNHRSQEFQTAFICLLLNFKKSNKKKNKQIENNQQSFKI